MSKIKVRLGNEVYPSKEAARKAIRALLHSAPIGVRLDSEAHTILRDLLAMHPSAEEKRGAGLVGFMVRLDSQMGTRQFVTLRVDGTGASFSYKTCFEPWRASNGAALSDALRSEIADQVAEFRRIALRQSGPVDAVTGEPIAAGEIRVDHAHPWTFVKIALGWIESRGLRADQIAVKAFFSGSGELRLADRDLAADWAEYHRLRAVLRLVSERTNQALKGAA